MTSNLESIETSKSSNDEKPKIWVEPQKDITFVCNKHQIVGVIKIHAESIGKKIYQYQIKTTNKANYKVSEPYGIINKSPFIIYIYLKKIGTLEETLSDKFKVLVIDKKKMKTVFSGRYGVIIESNLCPQKEELLTQSNASKGTSIYTNPSILGESSSTKKSSFSALRMSQVDTYSLMKKQDPQRQALKEKVNESVQILEKRKRREMALERQLKNKKARFRFSIYLMVMVVLVGFVIGFYGKEAIDLQLASMVKLFVIF